MFKSKIKTSIFVMVVVALLFGILGVGSAFAEGVPSEVKGTAYVMNSTWNGNMDWTSWDSSNAQAIYIQSKNIPFSDYKKDLAKKLGYEVEVFALVRETCEATTYKAVKPADTDLLSLYPICPGAPDKITHFVFMKDGPLKPLYKMWLLWKSDGTTCALISTKHPSVWAQNTYCFPGDQRYPDGWSADKAVCSGVYYSNGKWDCDKALHEWSGKKGE